MNYFSFINTIKPMLVLFFTSAGRKVWRAAKEATVRVLRESLKHPEWTDEDRRAFVVFAIEEELGEEFPGSAWLIRYGVEWAVGAIRAALNKKTGGTP